MSILAGSWRNLLSAIQDFAEPSLCRALLLPPRTGTPHQVPDPATPRHRCCHSSVSRLSRQRLLPDRLQVVIGRIIAERLSEAAYLFAGPPVSSRARNSRVTFGRCCFSQSAI